MMEDPAAAPDVTHAADMTRRSERMKALLDKRNENRMKDAQHKREEDVEQLSKAETYDYFTSHFKEELGALRTKLDNETQEFDPSNRADIADHFEELSNRYETLLKFVNDSTVFLRPFQLEQAQKSLNQLIFDITSKKQLMMPKKKFAFKSKKKTEAPAKDKTSINGASGPKKFDFFDNICGVSDKSGEKIILRGDEINQHDVSLSKLVNCRLELPGYPGTVHLSEIKDCVILCGPVSGSVFVDNCDGSKVVTGCQQLRVHNTKDTDFYLHVSSRAIIEDTSAVRFAPYNWSYQSLDRDFVKSGLNMETNNWNKVDDFNWLSADTPSPNWSVLPESEREIKW